MSLTVTPKQARLWALVLLGTVVTLAGVVRSDAVLLTAGATFLGVPALMAGGTPSVQRVREPAGTGTSADESSVAVEPGHGTMEEDEDTF